jgi:hypothetical protein
MTAIVLINAVLATTVVGAIVGVLAASIATAPFDRGVTLVRPAHRPRFQRNSSRPAPRRVARA